MPVPIPPKMYSVENSPGYSILNTEAKTLFLLSEMVWSSVNFMTPWIQDYLVAFFAVSFHGLG